MKKVGKGSANNGFGPIPWKNEYQYWIYLNPNHLLTIYFISLLFTPISSKITLYIHFSIDNLTRITIYTRFLTNIHHICVIIVQVYTIFTTILFKRLYSTTLSYCTHCKLRMLRILRCTVRTVLYSVVFVQESYAL